MIISNPSNSLEWMVFLAQKYSSMFIKGTWLTLYISVVGTLLGFVLGYIVGIAAIRRTEAASCHCQVTLYEPGGAFV